MRIGLGPVFAYEWLRTARNWRVYAVRLLFGLGLLAILSMTALSVAESFQYRQLSQIQAQAEAGQAFSTAIIMTQLSLILLVAPAATAGTICLDKQRGTLAHVLVTDLTGAEVVLGKLAARLIPTLGLILSSLGIMAICTLMGGVDPMALTGALLVTLGTAVLAGSLALCLSIWAGKTHEVVMTTYLILVVWIIFYPTWYAFSFMGLGIAKPPEWLEWLHPYWIISDVRPGAVPLHRHAYFMLGCFGIAVLLAAIATFRVRAVAIRQMNRPARQKRRWFRRGPRTGALDKNIEPRRRWRFRLWPGPSLDGNPVLWREWHRARPSRWLRGIWWIYALGSIAMTTLGVFLIVVPNGRGAQEGAMIMINGFQVSLGLLLLSVSAATALAEERVRGSLDVLLATPLSTWSIVWGKWRGSFRTVPVLAIAPAVLVAAGVFLYDPSTARMPVLSVPVTTTAGAVSSGVSSFFHDPPRWVAIPLVIGLTIAYGAAITSFGLAMATWISRLDRAVAATVGMYVFMAVGWLFLVAMAMRNDNLNGPGVCSGSPFMGMAYTCSLVVENYGNSRQRWAPQVGWATFWVLLDLSFAAALLKLTAASFNRKLGRIPEEGLARRPTPPLEKPKVEMPEEAVVA